MRKAIIAAIVASALFAVGAFAAQFTVTEEDVASGEADVQACASDASVDWTTSTTVGTDGEFIATGATITFTEVGPGACAGQVAEIAVGLDTSNAIGDTTSDSFQQFSCGAISAGATATCSFGSPGLAVSQIEDVSVLAEGFRVS